MSGARRSGARRLGRPPATDSGDTRRRILDTARDAFARGGYDTTTNRELANDVGITAGALYHYFGSKLDLYLAVHADVQTQVYDHFNEAVESSETFVDKFDAVLDMAHHLNGRDPTLAAFLGVVRSDMRRHPEIADALAPHAARRDDFFVRLVDAGVATGEISVENRGFMIAFISTILIGLTDGVSDDSARHQQAIESIKLALRGDLLGPPSP